MIAGKGAPGLNTQFEHCPGDPTTTPQEQTIVAQISTKPGDRAPEFALPTLTGEQTVRLADYRGRHVILFFIREFT